MVDVTNEPTDANHDSVVPFFDVFSRKLLQSRPLIIGNGLLSRNVAKQFVSMNIKVRASQSSIETDSVEDVDYVLTLSDQPQPSLYKKINAICLERRIMWSLAAFDGTCAFATTFIPRETACYVCFEGSLESTLPIHEMAAYLKLKEALSTRSTSNYIPPALVDLVSGFIGAEAINIMGGRGGQLAGKGLFIHLPTQTFEIDDVFKIPRCAACREAQQETPTHKLHTSLRRLLDIVEEDKSANNDQ